MRLIRLFTACLGSMFFCSLANAQVLNLIQKENRQMGTTSWQLTDPADNGQIEGYASLTSVAVGGNIELFVNTKDSTYTLTVFRMGWYQGKGARRVLGPQVLLGVPQPAPTTDPATGVLECHWTNPFTIHVPTSFLSGIYLVKLHANTSGKESYIIFTVRDSRTADIVFQQSVLTYHAYNPWPDSYGLGGQGNSLYDTDANGVQIPAVSLNRPYGGTAHTVADAADTPAMFYSAAVSPLLGIGAGDFFRHYGPTAMDFGMVRWLEHEGYDVTYITDVDTHEDVNRLLRAKGYLSVGHDEYWSEEMKSNVIKARDHGVGLGFFGGNYMYWAVELNPDSSGSPNRTISLVDPTKTLRFTDTGEPEQAVVGGNWVNSVPTNGDIVVPSDAPLDHWVFANTGLQVGDVIPGLIGPEYNATYPGVPIPNGLQTLLHTQAPRFEAEILAEDGGGFDLPDDFNMDFNGWYDSWVNAGKPLTSTCDTRLIPPLNIAPPTEPDVSPHPGWCRNARPIDIFSDARLDWAMTIYQASSGAWVFNAATNQWSWGLDDYMTGLVTSDGANNGPAFRIQCGYSFFHPKLVSCKNPAIAQITRNVLNRFIAGN